MLETYGGAGEQVGAINSAKGGAHVIRHGDDANMHVEFYTKTSETPHKRKSEEAGHPVFETKPYIRMFYQGGDVNDRPVNASDKQRWPHLWARYEAGEEKVVDGYPYGS